MDPKAHWETIYQTKKPDEVSWFQRQTPMSAALIRRTVPERTARIIDVGAGASRLIDDLVTAGYLDLTVLDISGAALNMTRRRLGDAATDVRWIEADVLSADLPPERFDLWHDRAVFHFLGSEADRAQYLRQVRRAVKPGGHVLVAAFADDGPMRCSGLPVTRYSADALHETFGPDFRLVESLREAHTTPSGATQAFVYCLMRLSALPATAPG